MDESRFDTIIRSFAASSRRSIFSALVAASAGFAVATNDAGARDRRNRRRLRHDRERASDERLDAERRRKKKRKKKNSAPQDATTTVCTPNCANKTCGPNGCGGFCGSCIGGFCLSGQCICAANEYDCFGRCCANGQACFGAGVDCADCDARDICETGQLEFRECGRTGAGEICMCVTSVNDATACVPRDKGACVACDADTDCQLDYGHGTQPGVCVNLQNCANATCPTACLPIGCA